MKKIKLNLQHLGFAEILTKEQLKKIVGGMGSGGRECENDSQCAPYERCCPTTDGSSKKVCSLVGSNGGCPSSVSGCTTSCKVSGSNWGCYWSPISSVCRCAFEGIECN